MSSVRCTHKKWILRDDKWTRRDFRPHRIINQIFGLDEAWRRNRNERSSISSSAGFNDYLLGKSGDARVKHDTQRSFYRFSNLLVFVFYFFDLAQGEITAEWKILLRQLTSLLILDDILGICWQGRKDDESLHNGCVQVNLQHPWFNTQGVSIQHGPVGPTEPQIGDLQHSLGSNIGGGQQLGGTQQLDGGQQSAALTGGQQIVGQAGSQAWRFWHDIFTFEFWLRGFHRKFWGAFRNTSDQDEDLSENENVTRIWKRFGCWVDHEIFSGFLQNA